jgi:membrane protein
MASLWKLGGLTWTELGRRVWAELGEDAILGRAAQLAFYFLLSIFPLLLFLTVLLGYFLGAEATMRDVLMKYLSAVAPALASGLIETTLQEIAAGASGGKLSFGLLIALWAASSGIVAISNSLNTVYEVEETRPWWKTRLTALALMVALVVLMSTPLVLIIYGGRIAEAIATYLGLGGTFMLVWNLVQWPLVLAFVLLAFNVVYLYAPNITHWDWHWLMPGTVVGVCLWLLVSLAFKLYLSFFNVYSATYGSLGAVIVLLLWFYLTGIAILIGGEVNSTIERAAGKAEAARRA